MGMWMETIGDSFVTYYCVMRPSAIPRPGPGKPRSTEPNFANLSAVSTSPIVRPE